MIHYALICEGEHDFEGWFRSSEDFDRQVGADLVVCPSCGSTKVSRAVMAPAVQPGCAKDRRAEASAKHPVVAPDPRASAIREAIRELRRTVTENADYVGDRFADEARKMHYGEIEHRGIYGEATGEDARALAEEGIEVHPLPVLPDDRN